jgi:hypothetical protein
MEGIHLCALRLKRLRLNTMWAMDWRRLEDIDVLRKTPGRHLAKLGRLSVPMVRRRGEKGFRRLSWDDAITLAAEGLKAGASSKNLGWALSTGRKLQCS